jgi:aryl-alcohol dehydrogenase
VKARSIVKVGEEVPLDSLAPLGCGIMTGAGGLFTFDALNSSVLINLQLCSTL